MEEPQNEPQSPVKEGDVLAGKYRVERVLGVGGMGVVVAAMHMELEERVALKFLLPAAAQNPAVVARFNREARAAAKIKSQHVARVTDVGTLESGTPYIVMEYLEGADLSDLLEERGRLPAGIAVDYVLQATEAIAEAHAAGFVHRDLKPANLFLARQADGASIVKVLDFGISKAVLSDDPGGQPGGQPGGGSPRSALTGTTEVFGSPLYMSPEQLKSARDVDARADIWALGIILYELISGRAPFDRPTVPETFGAILYEKPEPLRKQVPDLPAGLDQAILRCLEKDKAARPANVAELAKALLPFAASATRASLDRTSRVLRRAGLVGDSVAPPPGPGDGGALPSAKGSSPAAAQTRTAWNTASQVPAHTRAGSRGSLVAGLIAGMLAVGVGSVFLVRKLRPSSSVPVQADRATLPPHALPPPTTTPTTDVTPAVSMGDPERVPQTPPVSMGDPPKVPQTPPVSMGDPPKVPQTPPVSMGDPPKVPHPPPVSMGDPPKVAHPPPVSMGDPPKVPHVGNGKAGHSGKAGPGSPAPTAAPPAGTAKPPPKPADSDDFGDRK